MRGRAAVAYTVCFALVFVLHRVALAEEEAAQHPATANVLVSETDREALVLLWRTGGSPTESPKASELDGRFVVTAGEGCLIALRPEFAPARIPLTIPPSAVHRLDPIQWEPGVRVTGKVTGVAGEPLVAHLTLTKPSEDQTDLCVQAQREGDITAALSDESGHYALGPVAPGTYTLTAASDRHESVTRTLVLGSSPPNQGPGPLVLQEIAELELSFDLSEVREEPPFEITLFRQAEGWYNQQDEWPAVRSLTIADDAPLVLTMRPGFHRLKFSKDGTDVHFVQEALLTPGINFIEVRPWPIKVYGKVSKGDEPVEGAEVLFMCSGSETSVTSSEEGGYEARLWTATVCGVSVHAPEGGAHATSIDLRAVDFGNRIELSLELPDNVVMGTVVDASTGEGIPGAAVRVSQLRSDRSGQASFPAVADGDGKFEFSSVHGDSPRTVLYGDAEGYLPTSKEIEVSGGGPTMVRLELNEASGVRGRVVGPGGEPVNGAVVGCCAIDPRQQLLVSGRTSPQGEFSLDAMPGAVVFAAAAGYTMGWASAQDADEETTVRLAPRIYPALLRLLDDDGSPVAGVWLFFSSASAGVLPRGLVEADSGLNQQRSNTDENGYLSTASLPPGFYQVLVETPGMLEIVGVITVPFSGEVTLHLPAAE